MMTRSLHAACPAFIVVLLATAGCDDGPRGHFVARGVIAPSPVLAASLVPTAIPFDVLPAFSCPALSPFRSTIALFIDQRTGLDVTLEEVSFRFVDTFGFGTTVFFGQHDLNTMFGIPFIASGGSRLFTFQPAFGCEMVAAPQSLVAQIIAIDRSGRRQMQTLNGVFR